MKAKRLLINLIYIVAGSAVYSVAVNAFAVPNEIVQGGLTGLSTMLNHLVPLIPVGVGIFAMNIPLFIAAKRKIGTAFVLSSLFATFVLTLFIDLGSLFIPAFSGDKLLASVFCGVLSGTGLALVLLSGATTGGTEIIAVLARMKLPQLSLGRIMLVFDFSVVALSWLVYGRLENVMYAMVSIFMSTRMIDLIVYGNSHSKLILAVTEKADALSKEIISKMKRGVTILPVKGGYTGNSKGMLLCAVRASEVTRLNRLINEADENAFCIICDVGDVIGEGFTKD